MINELTYLQASPFVITNRGRHIGYRQSREIVEVEVRVVEDVG